MPVSLQNSQLIYDTLKACDVRIISALPETWLVHLLRMADDDPEMTLVRLAKEEEGVGISAGAHLAGVKSALLMQNHGLLQSVNGIVGVARLYRIPLLGALSIPYARLEDPAHVATRLQQAQTLAEAALKPVALLLCRALMWEE
jgi:sulfopyruvate decarboxylase subunit alpha